MGLLHRLEMRQGQALVMTPQLLQAIKLLQLSHLDLATYVDAELERNPLLERAEVEAHDPSEAAARRRRPARTAEARTASTASPRPSRGCRMTSTRAAARSRAISAPASTYVFPDDGPAMREAPGGGEGLSLTPAPWGSAGGSFDGEAPDFEASLTVEILPARAFWRPSSTSPPAIRSSG